MEQGRSGSRWCRRGRPASTAVRGSASRREEGGRAASGPTSTSGRTTTPTSRKSRYSPKDSARVRTMPRRPAMPYMIVIASTSTLSARDPDQSAIRKPMEMISNRPPDEHLVEGRLDDRVDRVVGEGLAGQGDHLLAEPRDRRHVEAARPRSRSAPARPKTSGGSDKIPEERRLGAEPGDPVADADADGPTDHLPDLGECGADRSRDPPADAGGDLLDRAQAGHPVSLGRRSGSGGTPLGCVPV